MKIFFDFWNELLEINLCTKFHPNSKKMRKIETIDTHLMYIEKMTYDITGWSCDIFMKLFFEY